MELAEAIALSSVVLGFCGVVITALLRFTPSKKNNPGNSKVSEKVFDEFRIGLERWMKGIDEKIGKIFDKLDEK